MDSPTPSLPENGNSLLERVRNVIASSSLLPQGKPLIIAVSGGPDSVCLLHLLSSIFPDTKRIVVYVDHGLRPLETEAEAELVRRQAEECGAEFLSVTVDVQKEKEREKSSLEAAARRLRYRAMEDIRSRYNGGAIVVAHTADDQAEEILLRLIRGSGRSGLSGMNPRRGQIIRPLLGERKESLVNYLTEREIPFCHDSSNDDPRFLRNRIRLQLLPTLEREYNRSIRRTLLQSASILDEEDVLLAEMSEHAYRNSVRENSGKLILDLEKFSAEHRSIRRRILEKICWSMGSRPSFQKIESLLELGESHQSGRELHLAEGLRAVRQGKHILFHCPSPERGYRGPAIPKKTFPPLTIPGPGSYPVPELEHQLLLTEQEDAGENLQKEGMLLLDNDHITFPLLLRPPLPGDRFHPLGAPGRKQISRFLSDRKIPTVERDLHPVLLSGNFIIALVGLCISDAVRVQSSTKRIVCLEWKQLN